VSSVCLLGVLLNLVEVGEGCFTFDPEEDYVENLFEAELDALQSGQVTPKQGFASLIWLRLSF